MKILKLSFENINSLKGKWQINFEDPSFEDNALFAITGATGSGKTTILDVICLALYGETPRVKISASQNELMSIGTAYCSSEVILQTGGKIYRIFWSQRRANQKSDGKLQAAIREIALLKSSDDNEGKILQEKASGVKAEIEKILGMNLDQFTRSVMLAQGNFAAFLQSNAEQRGEILEQITGTQIYATIGQAVFEKHKSLTADLKELNTKLGEVKLLDSDGYQDLLNKINENNQKKVQLEATIKSDSELLNTVKNYQHLTRELSDIQSKHQENLQAIEDFSTDQARLSAAKNAQAIEVMYQKYCDLEQSKNQKLHEFEQLQVSLPTLKSACDDSKSQVVAAEQQLQQYNAAYETQKPIFQEIRAIDQQIHLQTTQYADSQTQLDQALTDQVDLQIKIRAALDNKENLQKHLGRINATLQITTADELFGKLTQAEQYFSEYQHAVQLLQDKQAYHQKTYGNAKSLLEHRHKLRQDYQAIRDQHAAANLEFQNVHHTLCHALALDIDTAKVEDIAAAIDTHQQAAKNQANTAQQLSYIQHLYQEYETLAIEADQLTTQTALTQADLTKANQMLDNLTDRTQVAQTLFDSLESNYELHKQILHMKSHFDRLHSGEPCPLCGATEHPYKQLPNHLDGSKAASAQKALAEQKQVLDALLIQKQDASKLVDTLATSLDFQKKSLEHIHNKQQTKLQNLSSAWQQLPAQIHQQQALPAFTEFTALIDAWHSQSEIQEQQLQLIQNHWSSLNSHKNNVDMLHINKQNLLGQADQLQEQIHHLFTDLYQVCEQSSIHIRSMFDHINTIVQTIKPDMTTSGDMIVRQLNDMLANLPVMHTSVDIEWIKSATVNQLPALPSLDTALLLEFNNSYQSAKQNLQSQHAQLQSIEQDRQEIERQLISANSLEQNLHDQLTKLDPVITSLQAKLKSQSQTLSQLTHQRTDLFGDQSVDTAETKLQTDIKVAQETLTDLNLKNQTAEQQLARTKASLDTISQVIRETTESADHAKIAFEQALDDSEFDTQASFLFARLQTSEIAQLQSRADVLNNNLRDSQINLTSITDKLATIKKNHQEIDTYQADELAQLLDQRNQDLATLNQQIGTYTATKNLEDNNRLYQSKLIDQIDKQTKETAVWAKLDLLIGSANGKKYRNFVQGLTLDVVLHHANEILSKMSDRYVLTHDNEQDKSLEIMVTDLYQGDAIRSSKNLSGGETFIISLALALGLSQINSQKVQIESLFLDEGFGTLDETALDVALNTLFELQQNGKSIGIISHVASLKERIDTQIVIEKSSNGSSIIKGAGVRKLTG